MLCNGVGKTRANRFGGARPPAEWRTLMLSTGEVRLADKVGEDNRASRVAAGQQIRLIDLEADAGAGMGLFEDIHGHSSPAEFARYLKNSAESSYGHAGPEFVAKIAEDIPTAMTEINRLMNSFVALYRPRGKIDGQVERVIRKFALVAAAGEMAIGYGVVPWSKGTAMSAVSKCFQDWIGERGTTGALEDDEAVKHVRSYLEEFGGSRFFNEGAKEDEHSVLDIRMNTR